MDWSVGLLAKYKLKKTLLKVTCTLYITRRAKTISQLTTLTFALARHLFVGEIARNSHLGNHFPQNLDRNVSTVYIQVSVNVDLFVIRL